MLKTVMSSVAVHAFGLALGISVPAAAAPAGTQTALDTSAGQIIQIYGGCGVYGHRGPYGGCRTGGQFGGYAWGRSCPGGFHIGPYGRRCRFNRYL